MLSGFSGKRRRQEEEEEEEEVSPSAAGDANRLA